MATTVLVCRVILCIALLSFFSETHVKGDSTHALPILDFDSIHGGKNAPHHHHENFIKKIKDEGGQENKDEKKKVEEQDGEGTKKEIIDDGEKENAEKRKEEKEQQQDADPSVFSSNTQRDQNFTEILPTISIEGTSVSPPSPSRSPSSSKDDEMVLLEGDIEGGKVQGRYTEGSSSESHGMWLPTKPNSQKERSKRERSGQRKAREAGGERKRRGGEDNSRPFYSRSRRVHDDEEEELSRMRAFFFPFLEDDKDIKNRSPLQAPPRQHEHHRKKRPSPHRKEKGGNKRTHLQVIAEEEEEDEKTKKKESLPDKVDSLSDEDRGELVNERKKREEAGEADDPKPAVNGETPHHFLRDSLAGAIGWGKTAAKNMPKFVYNIFKKTKTTVTDTAEKLGLYKKARTLEDLLEEDLEEVEEVLSYSFKSKSMRNLLAPGVTPSLHYFHPLYPLFKVSFEDHEEHDHVSTPTTATRSSSFSSSFPASSLPLSFSSSASSLSFDRQGTPPSLSSSSALSLAEEEGVHLDLSHSDYDQESPELMKGQAHEEKASSSLASTPTAFLTGSETSIESAEGRMGGSNEGGDNDRSRRYTGLEAPPGSTHGLRNLSREDYHHQETTERDDKKEEDSGVFTKMKKTPNEEEERDGKRTSHGEEEGDHSGVFHENISFVWGCPYHETTSSQYSLIFLPSGSSISHTVTLSPVLDFNGLNLFSSSSSGPSSSTGGTSEDEDLEAAEQREASRPPNASSFPSSNKDSSSSSTERRTDETDAIIEGSSGRFPPPPLSPPSPPSPNVGLNNQKKLDEEKEEGEEKDSFYPVSTTTPTTTTISSPPSPSSTREEDALTPGFRKNETTFQKTTILDDVKRIADLSRLGEDPSFDEQAYQQQRSCDGLFHWRPLVKSPLTSDLQCVWKTYGRAFEKSLPPQYDKVMSHFYPEGRLYRTLDTVTRWYTNRWGGGPPSPSSHKSHIHDSPHQHPPKHSTGVASGEIDQQQEQEENLSETGEGEMNRRLREEEEGHHEDLSLLHLPEDLHTEEDRLHAQQLSHENGELATTLASSSLDHTPDEQLVYQMKDLNTIEKDEDEEEKENLEEEEKNLDIRLLSHSDRIEENGLSQSNPGTTTSLATGHPSSEMKSNSLRRHHSFPPSSSSSSSSSSHFSRHRDGKRRGVRGGLFSKGAALLSKTHKLLRSRLTTFVWALIQKLSEQVDRQKKKGLPPNIGKAFASVLEHEGPEVMESAATTMLLGLACTAHTYYSDLYAEGYDAPPPTPSSWPAQPFLAWLLQSPSNGEFFLPRSIPDSFTVKVSHKLPLDETRGWRLALYEMWHTLWFMVTEISRADFLWPWAKMKGVDTFFPWWTVTELGVHRVIERRPVRYANGVWRFKNIDPETMRLIDEDADPFELHPPPRTHHGGVSGDGLVTEATEEEAPWEFMAEGVYAQFNDTEGDQDPHLEHKRKTTYHYRYKGKTLTIHPDRCGEDATFDFYFDTPFTVLLTPHDLVARVASDFKEQQQQKQHADGDRGEEDKGREEQPEKEGGEEEQGPSLPPSHHTQHHQARYTRVKAGLVTPGDPVHAVWVTKPTTLPKMWLINRMSHPLEREPTLSDHPDAKVHRGFRLLYQTSFLPRTREFISSLKAPIDSKVLQKVENETSPDIHPMDALRIAYRYRTASTPFTVLFGGHSQGGAAAQIAAFYFSKEFKKSVDDGTIRVVAVSFGAPSWGTPEMYAEFRRSGVILLDIAGNMDPVPFLVTKQQGLADDRKLITLDARELHEVKFKEPFAFDGRMWKETREKKRMKIIGATLGVASLLDSSLGIGATHTTFYYAALGLMSQRYPFIGWASYLAWPLVPPGLRKSAVLPDGMRGLRIAFRLLLAGEGGVYTPERKTGKPRTSLVTPGGWTNLLKNWNLFKGRRQPQQQQQQESHPLSSSDLGQVSPKAKSMPTTTMLTDDDDQSSTLLQGGGNGGSSTPASSPTTAEKGIIQPQIHRARALRGGNGVKQGEEERHDNDSSEEGWDWTDNFRDDDDPGDSLFYLYR
ncbi:lipase domain-containing [Cystoisospora suis]|uniref:Lipase domain-containing n=1 Tax=Cystoisospora suis TaxID=483139 RepID=A0A2C6KLC9_9APIC|nr:lipase domain-containing [Cystoisospora suis]